MSETKLYKVTLADGNPSHGGSGCWSLPKGSRPGAWMPVVENPLCCTRGYHLVTDAQLLTWLDRVGLVVWEAEGRGKRHANSDKAAYAEARLIRRVGVWSKKTARLFAADCAEHVLAIFEEERPNDDRPRNAIEAARAFAMGKIDAAARDAAWAAAWAAEQKYQTRRLFYWLKRS